MCEGLVKYLGSDEKVPFNEGDEVLHPNGKIFTKVLKKYKDALRNDKILTEYTRNHVLRRIEREERLWRKEVRRWGLENIHNILSSPDLILFDLKGDAILYCKKRKTDDKERVAAVVVDAKERYFIYTVMSLPYPPEGLKTGRYVIIYSVEEAP